MAVTFLIRAGSGSAPHFPKGTIVTARPAGFEWGAKEVPPEFIRVTVNAWTYKQVKPYLSQFIRRLKWSVVSSDAVTDTHRLRITSDMIGSGGIGGYSAAEVQGYLQGWNATNITGSAGEVEFDLNIYDAIVSGNLFDIGGETYVENNYDQVGGEHTVTVTLPAEFHINHALNRMIDRGADILSVNGRDVQMLLTRDDVRQEFARELRRTTDKRIAQRRYAITEAAVNQALGNGGIVTVPASTFTNVLIDRAEV